MGAEKFMTDAVGTGPYELDTLRPRMGRQR